VRTDEDRLLEHINSESDAQATADLSPESLFSPDFSEYDIVISINPKHTLNPSKKRKSELQFKNLEMQQTSRKTTSTPLAQLFAQELLDIYGDAVLWFWDVETLDKIVGLWNPVVTGQRSWKIKAGWNSEPVRKKGEEGKDMDAKVNKPAVVNEIKRLGGDLIKEIEVKV
jgi:U3 small nucleolar RNA-associated protein 22